MSAGADERTLAAAVGGRDEQPDLAGLRKHAREHDVFGARRRRRQRESSQHDEQGRSHARILQPALAGHRGKLAGGNESASSVSAPGASVSVSAYNPTAWGTAGKPNPWRRCRCARHA